jgi:nitroreductase
VFGHEPIDRKSLDELFELARWAPNHHGTNSWRFRVLVPGALTRLKQAAGREQEAKLGRAPTLVVSAALSGDPLQEEEEDLHGAAIAASIVPLVAHARSFAGNWRTPAVQRPPESRRAVGLTQQEHVLGLLHLGRPRQHSTAPKRMRHLP